MQDWCIEFYFLIIVCILKGKLIFVAAVLEFSPIQKSAPSVKNNGCAHSIII